MRKIIAILIFASFTSFAQEALFNINKQNMHILNYAYFTETQADVSIDNSFEYYDKDRKFNSTKLNLNLNIIKNFNTGLELGLDYQNGLMNITNFDAIFGYDFHFDSLKGIFIAANFGVISTNIEKTGTYTRYTNTNLDEASYTLYAQRANFGFSTVAFYKVHSIGISINHINQPDIPDDNDGFIPIKYSAYIRSSLIKEKLVAMFSYQYQDKYLYDNLESDYYYNMLSYLGVNLEYYFLEGFNRLGQWNIGLADKILANNINIISAQVGWGNEDIYVNYSPSLMIDNNAKSSAFFNQIGVYFNISSEPVRKKYRAIGGVSF